MYLFKKHNIAYWHPESKKKVVMSYLLPKSQQYLFHLWAPDGEHVSENAILLAPRS